MSHLIVLNTYLLKIFFSSAVGGINLTNLLLLLLSQRAGKYKWSSLLNPTHQPGPLLVSPYEGTSPHVQANLIDPGYDDPKATSTDTSLA